MFEEGVTHVALSGVRSLSGVHLPTSIMVSRTCVEEVNRPRQKYLPNSVKKSGKRKMTGHFPIQTVSKGVKRKLSKQTHLLSVVCLNPNMLVNQRDTIRN